jgi:DtxR family Mn-dependent transcriptional regulator
MVYRIRGKMGQARPTPTIEDYLGVIYTLDRDHEPVISARLAEWMDVSPPTVTATVRRMVRDGWVTLDAQKEIRLTDKGREAAQSVLRRHMLSELLLARMLNVPWSQVHHEADKMEHTISRETMVRLQERLDDPQTCPHGNPLPGHEGLLKQWIPLTETETGDRITIKRVHESAEENRELMRFLEEQGLIPGAEAIVEQIIPFNRTVSLQVEGRVVVLGFAVAERIHVQLRGE